MERSDSELVAAVKAGDQAALADIYDRYSDRLFGFCFSMLRNREEAADAVHDTFLKASQKLDQLRDPSRLRSWMFAIARNEVISITRQRARMDAREVPEMGALDTDIEQGPARAELQALVWEAAGALQPRDRELLELHLREGLEGAELSAALGVKTSHVHVLMTRMRGRMEKSMGSLLVARLGRDDCEQLDQLLRDWDGTFSLDVRSKVTRHIEQCDVCKNRRAAVLAPSSLAAAMPIIAAPATLRDRFMESMQSAGATTPGSHPGNTPANTAGWAADGFPKPLTHATTRALTGTWWAVPASIALFVGVIVGAIAFVGGNNSNDNLTLVVIAPTPAPTEIQTEVAEPEVTEPEETAIPEPVVVAPTASPEPAATVAPSPSPVPTPTTAATATPTATATPNPTARPALLTANSDVLDFGALDSSLDTSISNTGEVALNWTAVIVGPWFSASVGAGSLAPGDTETINVVFDRADLGEGDVTGELQLTSGTQTVSVGLRGSVEVPPVISSVFISNTSILAEGPNCLEDRAIVEASVQDDSGVASVVARFAPDGITNVDVEMTLNAQEVWTMTLTGVQNGAAPTLIVEVLATDVRGNQTMAATEIAVITCG